MLVTSALADYVDASGETYQSIDYIVATGGQWIVTDIRPTCTDKVKMKFRLSSTAKTQALYCSRTTMTTNTFTAFFIEGVVRCDRNTNTSTKGNTSPSVNGDTTFVADYASRRFSVNGIDQDVMMAEGDYTPGSDLMLFASHKKGGDLSADVAARDVDNRATYRLYYFELYSAGCEEPKHRLMPVRRKSDLVVGLYDSVVGKFYGPADNSEAFVSSPSFLSVQVDSTARSICTLFPNDYANITSVVLCAGMTTIPSSFFSGCNNLKDVLIPDTVTSIGKNAFADCSSLESIVIPDSVTRIDEGAFSGCGGLVSMVLPFVGSRRGIAESPSAVFGYIFGGVAFSGGQKTSQCYSSELRQKISPSGIYYYESPHADYYIPTSLKTVVLTDETMIGRGAFYDCSGLTSVTIPNSVRSIESVAFSGCSGLTKVTIPQCVCSSKLSTVFSSAYQNITHVEILSDVRQIGPSAFAGCDALMSVMIPNGVTSIGAFAFSGCGRLANVMIPDSVISIGDNAFYECSSLDSVTIPNGVKCVGTSTFFGCGGLANVTIPDSVISIGDKAFYGCRSLGGVTIPSSVVSIGTSTFSGCSELASVAIPDGVTNIGDSAFEGCCGLTKVTIPNSVTNMGDSVFRYCSGLVAFNVSSQNQILSTESGLLLSKDGKNLIYGVNGEEIRIPDSVTSIDAYAFYGCNGITSVIIPNGVTNVGDSAFLGCDRLASIMLPWQLLSPGLVDGLLSPADWALLATNSDGMKEYRSAAIGHNASSTMTLTLVGACDFTFDWKVSSASGDDYLRWYLDGVEMARISGTGGTWQNVSVSVPTGDHIIKWTYSKNGNGTSGADCGWVRIPKLTELRKLAGLFPDSYPTLRCVTLTGQTAEIPTHAFDGCASLTAIDIPSSVTNIGIAAFAGCIGLTSVVIPDSVTSIGDLAFSDCGGLTSVAIPDSVMCIGASAFYNCSSLTNVTIGSGVTSIGTSAFSGCSGLTSVTIPDSVTSIGQNAFYNCNGLMSVTIPDSVTSIGSSAFSGCNGLKDVVIPQYVLDRQIRNVFSSSCPSITNVAYSSVITYIGSSAFSGCSELTSVTIPDSVTSIGYGAFYGCSGLTSITIPQVVCDMGLSTVFPAVYQTISSVHISDSVTNIADYAFAGCANLQTEVWGGYRVLDGWLIGYTDEAEETIPDADKLKGICSEALKGCMALRRLEFGDRARLVSIGSEALKGCTELKTLVLPPSLTRIGDEAFMGCSYLDNVIVPGGVKSIGNRAFKNCTGFTWAQIEHGVESIGEEAFCGCWRITEVDIPSSVSSIGANAFGGDSLITKVALRGDTRKVSEIFSTYAQITEATVKPGTGALVDGLFSRCAGLRSVYFIGNCPELKNDGRNLYEGTPYDSWDYYYDPYYNSYEWKSASLVTYVDKDSTGWDGTPGSHVLPMKWPLEGNYRREIMYTDAVSTPCAVAFDANGGTPKMQSEEQISESLFVLPNEPTREGYVFMGWWTEKNGGVKVTDETVFLTGVYETLYAHWLSERVVQAQVLEKVFSGVVTVELGEDGHIVVTLTLDVDGTVDIPDNVGPVTIDLNGHNMVGDDGGLGETALPGGPAIRIVAGDGEGRATRLAIVDTAEGEKGQIFGGGESSGIEVAEDAATGVKLDVEEGVGVFNGDGSEQELKPKLIGTGKVTVPKTWKTGQKVTWKATADKGSVFAHWDGPLVDSLNLTMNERRNPSLAFAVPEGFDTNQVTAVFIPIDDDGLYTLGITQTEFELKEAVSAVWVTDDSQSYVTATASGLPTGLKFDAKKMTITGTPTKSGVYWVQIKAKNASGYQWAENVRVTVSGGGTEAKEPKLTRTSYYPLTVICANEGGTVSGTGVYAEGKKVSVKATPAKGYVFAGWHETANSEKGTVNSVDGADYRSASLNVTVPETRYVFALFATKEDDADSLKVAVEDVTTEKDGTIALDLGACVASLSLPKLAVSGLPSGVKYDAKTLKLTGKATKPGVYTVTVKATNAAVTKATDASTTTFRITVPNFECAALPGLKPETDAYGVVRSGVIFDDGLVDCTPADGWTVKAAGLPAGLKFATKETKDAMYGIVPAWTVYGVPTAKAGSYTVTFTASKKGAANQIATITLNVEALPGWVVGTFYGKNVARGLRGTWTCPQQFTVTISANGKISMKTVSPGEGAESRTAQLTECREDGIFAFSFHYASGRKGKDGYSEGDCAGIISPVAYGEDGALLGCLTTQDIGVCDENDSPFESKGVVYQSLYSRKPAVSGLPVFGKDNIRVVPVKSDCSDGEVTLKFGTKGAVTAAWSGTKPAATCSSYISPYARDADGTVHAKLWLTFLDKTRMNFHGHPVQTGFEFDLLIPAADKVSASDVDVVSARLTSIIADISNGDDVELVQQ